MTTGNNVLEAFKNHMAQQLFGRSRKEGECVQCGKEVKDSDFRDDISRKEYKISYMCQECQDAFFEADEE